MLIFDIDSNAYNYLAVGAARYFLLSLPTSEKLVVNDRCPHRGGPLHLGTWRNDSSTLECPWHGTCWTLRALSHKGHIVPSIRRGHIVTAIFDEEDMQSPVDLMWIRLAQNETEGA